MVRNTKVSKRALDSAIVGEESVSMEHNHAKTDDITVRGRTEYFLETKSG